MIPFNQRLRGILYQKGITIIQFCDGTGISRENFFYRKGKRLKHCRYIYMAIAYYLEMNVEDLISGTDAEVDFYGDSGI